MRGLLLLAGALSGFAASGESQLYKDSYAIVAGVDSYQSPDWPRLSYAVQDARAMARYLGETGFEVIELYDEAATKQAVIAAMQNNIARKAGEGDRVLVFFAGHGYTESLGGRDWGYIVPYDGGSESASFISMEELRAQSAKMGSATHQLFIMDSCYGGSLGSRGVTSLSPDYPNYLREVTRRPARQFLTAGGKGQQVADGGPKGHSYFTGYLLEALEDGLGDLNGDRYITFSELSAYLVPRATSDLQTPSVGSLPEHGQGEFTFVSRAGGPSPEPDVETREGRRNREVEVDDDEFRGFHGPQAAEKLVSEYLAAMLSMDVDGVLALVDLPFYFDNEIVVRDSDLGVRLRSLFAEKGAQSVDVQIESIRAKTIREFQAEGYDASRDRVLASLSLGDDDYAITVRVATRDLGSEPFLVFARRTPAGLRIVGTWD